VLLCKGETFKGRQSTLEVETFQSDSIGRLFRLSFPPITDRSEKERSRLLSEQGGTGGKSFLRGGQKKRLRKGVIAKNQRRVGRKESLVDQDSKIPFSIKEKTLKETLNYDVRLERGGQNLLD